jgi:hypothetical protein
MHIPTVLANFAMCCVWFYIHVLVVRGFFEVMFYLVEMREERMKRKIESESEYFDLGQLYAR